MAIDAWPCALNLIAVMIYHYCLPCTIRFIVDCLINMPLNLSSKYLFDLMLHGTWSVSKRDKRRTHREEYRPALETANIVHNNNKLSNSNQYQFFRTVDRFFAAKSLKTLPSHDSPNILTSTL